MGEVRHLGEFGGLVPPPYRFVVRAWICMSGGIALPHWGPAIRLKYKKTYLTRDSLLWSRGKVLRRSSAFFH